MAEEIGEECGINGVRLKNQGIDKRIIPISLVTMNYILQNRGQKSSGIAVYNPLLDSEEYARETMVRHKGLGMVSEVFNFSSEYKRNKILDECCGVAGLGQNRYSTAGRGRSDFLDSRDEAEDEVQPFLRRHARPEKRMALVYNGNMANYREMCERMKQQGYSRETNVDTEVWMNLLAFEVNRLSSSQNGFVKPDLFQVMKSALGPVDGATNLGVLFGEGTLLFYRGGFHPLFYGENDSLQAFASESLALEAIGIKKFRDVMPGEAGIIDASGVRFQEISEGEPFCQFEDVYFMNSASVHDLVSVRSRRRALGENLARQEPLITQILSAPKDYIVVPSPKTAIPAAEAYSEFLRLDTRQAIEKREGKRGFINSPEIRKFIMDLEYIYHDDVFGKKVIVVDDSLVRGATSERQTKGLRDRGAKEVHFRFTEPPIRHPCFMGLIFLLMGNSWLIKLILIKKCPN
jgi:amidophosphoribosyltransferase